MENREEILCQKINDEQRIMNGRQRQSFERLWRQAKIQGPIRNFGLPTVQKHSCTHVLCLL
jgi:hypothetical protein